MANFNPEYRSSGTNPAPWCCEITLPHEGPTAIDEERSVDRWFADRELKSWVGQNAPKIMMIITGLQKSYWGKYNTKDSDNYKRLKALKEIMERSPF